MTNPTGIDSWTKTSNKPHSKMFERGNLGATQKTLID